MLKKPRAISGTIKALNVFLSKELPPKRRLCSTASKCLGPIEISKTRDNNNLSRWKSFISAQQTVCTYKDSRKLNNLNQIAYYSQLSCKAVALSGKQILTYKIQNDFRRMMGKKASKGKGKSKKLTVDSDMAEGIVDIVGTKDKMEKVVENMNQDFAAKIPARITAGFIDNIMVKTGSGKKVPLYEIASVTTKNDNFTIDIQDNLPNASKLISAAIAETGFNLIPQVSGNTLSVPIPMFTQDQRNAVGRIAKTIADQAKTDLRKVRQKAMSDIRKNKEGESKDLIKRIENMVQQLTDHFSEKVDTALDAKLSDQAGKLK